jgi:hypothetical protein
VVRRRAGPHGRGRVRRLPPRDPRSGDGACDGRGLPGRPRSSSSLRDDLEILFGDPVASWREWADDVRGGTIDSGHHTAAEAPTELAGALEAFVAEVSPVAWRRGRSYRAKPDTSRAARAPTGATFGRGPNR